MRVGEPATVNERLELVRLLVLIPILPGKERNKEYLGGDNNVQLARGAITIANATFIQQATEAAVAATIQHCAVAAPAPMLYTSYLISLCLALFCCDSLHPSWFGLVVI